MPNPRTPSQDNQDTTNQAQVNKKVRPVVEHWTDDRKYVYNILKTIYIVAYFLLKVK
jgi:hypothetical protein